MWQRRGYFLETPSLEINTVTHQLILRRPALSELRDLSHVHEELRFYDVFNHTDPQSWVNIYGRESRIEARWGIFDRANCHLGMVGLTLNPDCEPGLSAQIILAKAHQGKGIGKAALLAPIWYAFEQRKFRAITALVFKGNRPSLRLFEGAGFRYAPTLPERVVVVEGQPQRLLAMRADNPEVMLSAGERMRYSLQLAQLAVRLISW